MDFSEAAVSISKSTGGYILKPSSKCINSIHAGSAIKTKELYLLLERILNLKVRLTCIYFNFFQTVCIHVGMKFKSPDLQEDTPKTEPKGD